jgi:hypothetical protein
MDYFRKQKVRFKARRSHGIFIMKLINYANLNDFYSNFSFQKQQSWNETQNSWTKSVKAVNSWKEKTRNEGIKSENTSEARSRKKK